MPPDVHAFGVVQLHGLVEVAALCLRHEARADARLDESPGNWRPRSSRAPNTQLLNAAKDLSVRAMTAMPPPMTAKSRIGLWICSISTQQTRLRAVSGLLSGQGAEPQRGLKRSHEYHRSHRRRPPRALAAPSTLRHRSAPASISQRRRKSNPEVRLSDGLVTGFDPRSPSVTPAVSDTRKGLPVRA